MAKAPVKINENISYEDAVKLIKSFKGSQSIVGEEINKACSIERYITNIPTLDFLGGVTKGRVNMFVGPKSSAKSTACYLLIAKHTREIDESGETKFVLVWATEGYDAAYASSLGVNNKYVIIKRTKVLEDGLKECEELIRLGIVKAMMWDSLDMTIARKIEDNAYEATRGSNAGAYSDHLPKFYNALLEFEVTSYWIKQARVKQGGYSQSGAEILHMNGGKILEHIPDNIYFFKRMSNYNLTYTPVQIKCEKARSSKIGMVLELPLSECGFDIVRDAVNLGALVGFFNKAGSWYNFTINGKEFKVQGQENIIDEFREDNALFQEYLKYIYDKYILNSTGIVFASEFTMATELSSEEENVKTTD